MKRLVASVGLVALGVSWVQAADESYISAEAARPWSVAATLRGFYDDNINTVGANKQDIMGFSVTPQINFAMQGEQTTASANYAYSLIYYDKKPGLSTKRYDQDHTFTGILNHRFSERYSVRVGDSFVVGQEPDRLRAGDVSQNPQRIAGDNYRNYGSIKFAAQLTQLLGLDLGYANSYFNYADNKSTNFVGNALVAVGTNIYNAGSVTNFISSVSGTSDRIENTFNLASRWQLTPPTVGVLAYRYSQTEYTGDELIGDDYQVVGVAPTYSVTHRLLRSDSRNTRSHSIYVGLEHIFNPDLFGSANIGFSSTDAYNDPNGTKNTSPYARANLTYSYAPESSLAVGFGYDWNSTDVIGFQNFVRATNSSSGSFTVGSETANIFASINHRIIPRLFASITGQVQDSTFVGGALDGKSERYYLLGLNLQYRFGRHLSADVGYNYDKVDSDAGRTYDRNRIYVGVTGTY
jgi:hypothetical protein